MPGLLLNKPVCPHSITLHLPLFSSNSFNYIPWQNNDDNLLQLHYQSLNFTPPFQLHNQTLSSLDYTLRLLDGQLNSQITPIKQDLSQLHSVSSTTLNDRLTYFALTLLNTFIIILLYCCMKGPPNHRLFCTVLFKRKRGTNAPLKTSTTSGNDTELEVLPIVIISLFQITTLRNNAIQRLFKFSYLRLTLIFLIVDDFTANVSCFSSVFLLSEQTVSFTHRFLSLPTGACSLHCVFLYSRSPVISQHRFPSIPSDKTIS